MITHTFTVEMFDSGERTPKDMQELLRIALENGVGVALVVVESGEHPIPSDVRKHVRASFTKRFRITRQTT